MRALRRLLSRFSASATTSARDEALLQAEIDEHIALQTADNVRAGLPPDQARRQALLKFGGVEKMKDAYRDQRGLPWLETLVREMRHTLRGLRRTPLFMAAVIATLALGVGANSAVFAVIDGILIQPLPYPQPEALVSVWHSAPGSPGAPGGRVGTSPSMYFTYRNENQTFEHFGVWTSAGANVTGLAEPELARALYVSYGVLNAVGVPPLLGRWFAQADDAPGAPETVMLTHGYWQRRFGGDRSLVGRTLAIDARPRTVIGVMPESFRFQDDPELILPRRMEPSRTFLGPLLGTQGIARLKPGVTLEQANADVARMLSIWLNAWPPNPGVDRSVFQQSRLAPQVQPLKRDVVGDIGTTLWVVMATLGLVLLIACANITNLLLVRAEARQQELAIRAALGASRVQIARTLLLESLTLGAFGGVVGLGLAYGGLRVLVALGPDSLPRLRDVGIDASVMLFTFVVSLFAGLLFGLIPVVKYAGPRIATALRGVGRTFSDGRERHRAQNTLVVAQVALALILLIASGLMMRTFQQMRRVHPGFTQPEHLQVLHSSIPASVAPSPERVMRMQQAILDKLAAIPGVTAVGFANAVPMESFAGGAGNPVEAEDKPAESRASGLRRIRRVAPGFFNAIGTRIVAGRDFTWDDLYEGRRFAIVSENLAREWWGTASLALGKRIREIGAADPWREIIAVVEDVYDDGVQVKAPAYAYWPALMDSYIWGGPNGSAVAGGVFAIRSNRAGTESLLAEAQQAIWSGNGRQPVFRVTTLESLYDRSMARTSFTLVMLAIAAGMGLILGVVGIYGVIAYVVSRRTREIGIRAAFGARPEELLAIFVRHGLWLAGMGAALGLVAAVGLTRLMSSLLFGVAPLDPLTYTAVSALLIVVGLLASYFPARRAIAVDPIQALRVE